MLLRRPVVAQPAPAIDAAPLPVGIQLFQAPEERLAVIVKMTLSLRPLGDGTMQWYQSDKQDSLSLSVPSTLTGASEGEFAYPGDFVPRKGAVDIIVTGHARSAYPTGQIMAGFSVGKLAKSFCAIASRPTSELPLTKPYLRGPDGFSPMESLAAHAVPDMLEHHPTGFDFGVYGSAPGSQRIDELPPGSKIELNGLFASAAQIESRLPNEVPRAVLVSVHDVRIDVPLHCDTVVLDTDRECCILVFRGDVELPSPDLFDLRHVMVWLDDPVHGRSADDIKRQLARGTFAFMVAAGDLTGQTAPGDPAEVDLVKYSFFGDKPAPTISLEEYATVSAELAEGRWKRQDVLLRHNLDEDRWLLEERGILEIMADAAVDGNASTAAHYSTLFIQVQDSLAEHWENDQTLDDYIEVRAEMEVKGDPDRVLKARNMRLAPWMRLDRRMMRAAQTDSALRETIESRLLSAIRRLEGESEPEEPEVPEDDEL